MSLSAALTWVAVIFAVLAALLWLLSARVKTPESFPIRVFHPDETANNPVNAPQEGAKVGTAESGELSHLAVALRRQSELSARAAICAAVSALAQAAALLSQ